MENILDRAIIFATEAHKGQFRKGTQIPYILHPMEAAAIVSTMTTDSEIIAGVCYYFKYNVDITRSVPGCQVVLLAYHQTKRIALVGDFL